MPRFEVKVTKREANWSESQGALQSQKSKSLTECTKSQDSPELLAGNRSAGIPLSCRSDRGKSAS